MTTDANEIPTSALGRIADRLRRKPLVLVVILFSLCAGPAFAGHVFPEAPLVKQILGGWVCGGYFALCAIPEHFLEL